MTKFIVLYKSSVSAMEQMAKATPEQAKAGMEAWMTWANKAGKAIIDLGTPVGKGLEVAKGAVTAGKTQIGGFSILQAESIQDITKLLESHPHLSMPGASIDVLEALPLPECNRAAGNHCYGNS